MLITSKRIPLGRLSGYKLFGSLFSKEEMADSIFRYTESNILISGTYFREL